MSKVQTKETVKDIKVFDRVAVASERMRTALIRSKDRVENLIDDEQASPSEYAEDRIRYVAKKAAHRARHDIHSGAKKLSGKVRKLTGSIERKLNSAERRNGVSIRPEEKIRQSRGTQRAPLNLRRESKYCRASGARRKPPLR